MQVSGICAMCGRVAEPAYTCNVCGGTVCGRCFGQDMGLCKRCEAQMSRGV